MKEVIIMNKNDQAFLVEKIRTQYTEKEATKLDALRKLLFYRKSSQKVKTQT